MRFTRREVREAAGLSDKQVRVHLDRLVALEYVLAHHGRNGQRYVYELVFDGALDQDQPQLMGLIDVAQLKANAGNEATTDHLVASKADPVARSWSARGGVVARSCQGENTAKPRNGGASSQPKSDPTANSTPRDKNLSAQKCGTATLPSLAARSLEV